MRKTQRQQLLDIIQTLYEAHNIVKKNLEYGNIQQTIQLLGNCQSTAIQMGEIIEHSEGEACIVVRTLEGYCDELYQVTTGNMSPTQAQNIWKHLNKQLLQVENDVKYCLPIRSEVVFFPYKASMWDSLESIYLAAKNDPNCDAYCVPIPYFDKNPDGSLGQMHYEGQEYPSNIEVVDYRSYDYEKRKPDIIFIHNPYDDCNQVTSVHPSYYSKKLKQFTKQLVYVPYFTPTDVLPEGFCITPGCINADTVILSSEKVKNDYLHAFKNCNQEYSNKDFLDNVKKKLVVIGSPKLEKAAKCLKEDNPLPEAWQRIIEYPNGTKKTLIFYNISLNSLLEHGMNVLRKIREVFALFMERKDIVLWWRPHPLYEATLRSMRPGLLEEYQRIVSDYIDGQWGIYDNSTDLYRAIAWCDAYYGDQSSVTALFTAAQKPVMLQSVENDGLAFENIVKANGDYWFTCIGNNGLYRLPENSNTAEFIGCFTAEKDCRRLYLDIVHYQNKLIFVPLRAKGIAIYCIDTKKFIYIPIQEPPKDLNLGIQYSSDSKFAFASVYKKHIYLFPSTYPAIIRLNPESCEVEYLYDPILSLKAHVRNKNRGYFRTGIVQENLVKMWCVPIKGIVEFDMISETINICKIMQNANNYIDIATDGESYWLIPVEKTAKILKLSKEYYITKEIPLPNGTADNTFSYIRGVCAKDYLFVFPGNAEHVIKISLEHDFAEIDSAFEIDEPTNKLGIGEWKFFFAKKFENEIFAFNNSSLVLMRYQLEDGTVTKSKVITDAKEIKKQNLALDVYLLDRGDWTDEPSLYFYEENRFTLGNYLSLISNSRESLIKALQTKLRLYTCNHNEYNVENIGSKIYTFVMKNKGL